MLFEFEQRLLHSPLFFKMVGVLSLELDKRGLVKEGYCADLAIFDPKTIVDRVTCMDLVCPC
jgi:N-acyl-D-aspartate/D-glutamate deacylase